MGFWDALTGSAGKAISEPIKETGKALDNLFTSDEERLAFEDKMRQYVMAMNQGQVEINKLDATSPSWWNSGWRPGLGWSCAVSVALTFISQALVVSIMWVIMCWNTKQLLPYPNPHGLIELTTAILGIYGTQKTFEKIKGVS